MPIDYKKYPSNWKTEIRPSVLERAENCCEVCGVANGSTIFRGTISGQEVYQDVFADIYEYPSGRLLSTDDFTADIEPLKGNEEKQKSVKIVLTIAHLDHDETNHEVTIDRLKAMCQKCHLQYDAAEKSRRRKEKTSKLKLEL